MRGDEIGRLARRERLLAADERGELLLNVEAVGPAAHGVLQIDRCHGRELRRLADVEFAADDQVGRERAQLLEVDLAERADALGLGVPGAEHRVDEVDGRDERTVVVTPVAADDGDAEFHQRQADQRLVHHHDALRGLGNRDGAPGVVGHLALPGEGGPGGEQGREQDDQAPAPSPHNWPLMPTPNMRGSIIQPTMPPTERSSDR